jgi:molybdopterin-containing oxidoreductase family iron-sulfur binding subunit
VIACQAENNIPVVGKAEVIKQREMHWIRIDDYFDGPVENPAVYHQPVPCMHCEDAPCEIVCPVGATTHSPEGLNEMTYNRCVGTRFCSNNCPYKVRRFNFLLYSDYQKDSRSLQYNPDVSVRNRGVMEKCTYCVQRIDRTRIQMEREIVQLRELAAAATTDADRQRLTELAEKSGKQVVDRLETACQQSCPTRAITFGNIADPQAAVCKAKAEPANYTLLRNLTTKPRTSYLARVTNPNPNWTEGHSA